MLRFGWLEASKPRSGGRLQAALALLLSFATCPPLPAGAQTSERRFALLIANGNYQVAGAASLTASKDAKLLADELNRVRFDIDLEEDLGKAQMQAAIDGFLAKIGPGSVALVYFTGFGIQAARQSYILPTDVQIASEADVKREGISIDSLVNELDHRGAKVKIVIVDASRRNPYERQFRGFYAGLAGLDAPEGTLALYSAAPGHLSAEDTGDTSLFMGELTKEMRSPAITAEEVFTHARIGVSRASNGEQIPWVASSLFDDFSFGRSSASGGGPPPQVRLAPPPPEPPKPPTLPDQTAPKPPTPDQTASKPPTPDQTVSKPPPPDLSAAKPPSLADTATTKPRTPEPMLPPPPPDVATLTPPISEPKTDRPDPPPKEKMAITAPSTPAASEPVLTAPPDRAPVPPAPSSGENEAQRDAGQISAARPPGGPRDCADCPELAVLPAGSFDMGAGTTPFDRPVHKVTIARPFAISVTEVTFDQWEKCVKDGGCTYRPNDRGWGAGDRPVVNVSWSDAQQYVAWLSKETGRAYRLPSEAEWEYAARGGRDTIFSWGSTVGKNMANCRDCQSGAGARTTPVRSFPANGYGLFDMAGNAAEWVQDCWNENYRGAPRDGSPWLSGNCDQRVLRGGSFDSTSAYIKPAARFRYDADVRYYGNGFRVVRDTP